MHRPTRLPSRGGQLFSHRDWSATRLASLKAELGLSVSVCIPVRDEEATIGAITSSVRRALMERVALVDELLVVDDGSTDATMATARAGGATVVRAADVLPEAGPATGKGEAVWKSLAASRGDLVCWVDGDITDFGPRFVTGLLGPLLTRADVEFVKGFYRRPGGHPASSGGRVTELVARPLLCRLFPALAGIVQPLSGEFAGRRPLLEALPVVAGWGVDLGLVLDAADAVGTGAIAQVDLGSRRHRHRPLDQLAPQATAVLATALRRAGVAGGTGVSPDRPGPELSRLVRFDEHHRRHEVEVTVGERPPLASFQRNASGELAG